MENTNINKTSKTFSIKESLNFGWSNLKKHFWELLFITLISFFISFVLSILKDKTNSNILVTVIGQIVSFWLSFNIMKIYLNLVFGREFKVLDVFHFSLSSKYLIQLGKYFLVGIIYTIMIVIGFILLIIPGIYLAIRFQYAFYNIIEKDCGIMDSFKMSSQMTKGLKWKLALFMLITLFIVIAGLVCLIIGIIPAAIIITIAQTFIYKKLLSYIENNNTPSPVLEPEKGEKIEDVIIDKKEDTEEVKSEETLISDTEKENNLENK